jgi:preprotein translocase subunit SecB
MHPAKMQLKEYFVNELFFRAQTKFFDAAQSIDFRLKPADLEIEVSLGQNAENQNEKMCQLSLSLKDETEQAFPYVFNIVLVGFFDLDESACAGDEGERLLKINAPSVLYSAAREYLLLTTGRSFFAPVMLPTVTFIPAQEETTAKDKGDAAIPKKRRTAKTASGKSTKS